MKTPVLSEYRGLIVIIILMLVWISLSITTKYEYFYNYRIPKWMNIIFLNSAKNGTVPLLSFVGTIQLCSTVPILLAVKYFNPKLDLNVLSAYYLLLPWGVIVMPSILVCDWFANSKKKKRIKAEEEARIKMKRDNWIANNVKKKKKK